MTRKIALVASIFVAVAIAGVSFADHGEKTVTVEGEVMCAMCVMKTEGVKECQNVLRVEKGDDSTDFYLVKNEVAEEFGHACSGPKKAQVTGTVAKEDDKMWLTATEMLPVVKKVAN